jgi:membrane-bound ClpP family serine protease
MQSYQSVGLLIGIVTLVLGLIGSAVVGNLGIWVAIVSFIGMILVLLNPKHHRGVGIVLIILGIFGNLLLIIPGIMAYRYKPESVSEIRSQSKEEGARVKGTAEGEREKVEEERREEQRLRDEIKKLEDRKKELEKEKED